MIYLLFFFNIQLSSNRPSTTAGSNDSVQATKFGHEQHGEIYVEARASE